MAYPTLSALYGYKPVNLIGGQPFAGSTRSLPISYSYNTNIFYGDMVALSSGYVVLATYPVNSTNKTIGVFLGCYYTNPTTKQRLFSQYYPANTTAGDITAIVADDPDLVIRCGVASAAGTNSVASANSLLVGVNMVGTTLTGSTSTGNGAGGVVAATAAGASTAGFRVLQLVPDTQTSGSGTYSSGTGTTSLVVTNLDTGTYSIGTEVFNVTSFGLQYTGSFLTAASTVSTKSTSTSTTLTVTASTTAVTGTVALVQTPEVLVKVNFGVHNYNVA